MNKDQVKGAVKNAVGKVQQEAGKVIDSKEQQAKGIKKQAAGQTQKMVGDGKAAVKKS
ncbi:MAG: CsbD family protein [Burkholderiaceae bacterium]